MAGERMILSGDQIASFASSSTSWPPPSYQTQLQFQGVSSLGDADSRYIMIRTQGEGDIITNGNLFTIYTAVDDGSGTLVPGSVVMNSNFVTPDAYGGLGAGDDYLAFGMFSGQRVLIKLDGFHGVTSFQVTPGGDIAPGGDGEMSITEVLNARPTATPICFAAGTLIRTPDGDRPVQDLVAGDLVVTLDNGAQPLRWIGSQWLGDDVLTRNPRFCPIRIAAGALGYGLPATDLIVSPQHRVLVRSKVAMRMFGAAELLVAAKHLTEVEGVAQFHPDGGIQYHHILFDRHEIIFANGAETESLLPGPEALKSLGAAARDELFAIFPELGATPAGTAAQHARGIAPAGRSRHMAMRHGRNGIDLVEGGATS